MGKGKRARAERQASQPSSEDADTAAAEAAQEVPLEPGETFIQQYEDAWGWLEDGLAATDGSKAKRAFDIASIHAQLATALAVRDLQASIDGLATRADIARLSDLVQDMEHAARFAGDY